MARALVIDPRRGRRHRHEDVTGIEPRDDGRAVITPSARAPGQPAGAELTSRQRGRFPGFPASAFLLTEEMIITAGLLRTMH